MTNKEFIQSLTFIVILVTVISLLFSLANKRDKATAEYWSAKMEQCRSLGSTWDLNNQGECVQQEFN